MDENREPNSDDPAALLGYSSDETTTSSSGGESPGGKAQAPAGMSGDGLVQQRLAPSGSSGARQAQRQAPQSPLTATALREMLEQVQSQGVQLTQNMTNGSKPRS